MKSEVWKDIKGFEGRYQVSNMGRVRSIDRYTLDARPKFLKGRLLNPSLNKGRGYLRISLSDGHRNYKHFEVQRLVALHFVPGYQKGLVVNHINEIKTDNRAENLEWCTYQYNLNYSDVIAWKRRPVFQYTMEGDFVAKHKCSAEIEKMFGTYRGAMTHIMYESKTGVWNGYRWSFDFHTKEYWQEISKKYKSSRKPVARYDENGVELERYSTVTLAADKHGISVTAISHCCNGKTKHAAGYIWRFI